jgi:2-C-methyl-D-erythritol 2,4-cyclodiphosphate synthase
MVAREVALSRFRGKHYNRRETPLPRRQRMRVGLGHDTHRLGEGRPLLLGGVRVPHDRGLIGHSDADVVLHAVTDALLGAAALGDIGDAYPDTDPRWKDADSRLFLRETLARLNREGWSVVNLDVVILAQEPKLGPVKGEIRRSLAGLLAVDEGAVNVKAKTGEKVGHIGRAEAIACQVVVLIDRKAN